MRLWKWVAIGCTVAYVSMAGIMSRTGDIDGLSFPIVSVIYVILGVSVVFIADKMESTVITNKDSLLPISERFEKIERICNACKIDGGKMKCPHYRNPQAMITRCESSNNPDGKND